MMMRYRGGGVGHKSTRNATNVFLADRDPLDYPADQPNPLTYNSEEYNLPAQLDDDAERILELSDDEELLDEIEFEEEIELETQHDVEDVDGRLTIEEELGFSSL